MRSNVAEVVGRADTATGLLESNSPIILSRLCGEGARGLAEEGGAGGGALLFISPNKSPIKSGEGERGGDGVAGNGISGVGLGAFTLNLCKRESDVASKTPVTEFKRFCVEALGPCSEVSISCCCCAAPSGAAPSGYNL
jgi:hypothetical protein